ncbi:PmoA family protein [Kibdelosporangium persicum]|uniref:Methane oxygenase PmoA n=1 Tax=Kibdelosporangium persicum TaxID=2698649 RepID=A0ABX2F3R6_9PSEU|nr:PmoA family protein [Kibdelosporangium persicum]NRN65552.1 Methane oxygenase PmoA [Kibdelosporangium persicum]
MAVNLKITRHDESTLGVGAGDVEIFEYVYRPSMPAFEGPKPYLHPVRTLAGNVVTAYRPHDHRWHKGIQMTASDVSGQNFWGGGTYVRGQGYVDLPNVGTMRHEGFTISEEGPERIRFGERLSWHTQAGEHWVDEVRMFTVRDVDAAAWALDFATTLTNVRTEPLVLGSPTTHGRPLAGYTGLFWRGPRAFTDGDVIAADGLGGPDMMGKPARWLAYVGQHDEVDGASTLLFLDHPGNKNTHWFVRNTPFPAVNPSFAFFDPVELVPADTLDLRYRVVIVDGAWDSGRLQSYVEEHPW